MQITASPGSAKYGASAAQSIDFSRLGLPDKVQKELQIAASHSMAGRTWQSYKTAERMLAKYLRSCGKKPELPVSEKCMLGFVHWLAFERQLKASSISGYLAGIRKLHIMKGIEVPEIRTELVNMVLDGKKNMDATSRLQQVQKERQPVTIDIMKLLKTQIMQWQAHQQDKLTAWVVCSLLFHAACRGGELLCRTKDTFDPAVNLLRKDLYMVGRNTEKASLQVKLKTPKESKDNRAVIVDVFGTGSQICPLRAFTKWERATAGAQADQPAFKWADGSLVTTNAMNILIKKLLDEYIPGHRISVHSFRTGTASMMAQLGYSDKDIKAVGRWSSRAFENYIKLPRSKKLQTLQKLGKNMEWE